MNQARVERYRFIRMSCEMVPFADDLVARQAPLSREPAEPLSIAAGALRQALRWKSEPTGADGESDEDGPSPE
jgi:hypothetical protein